MGERSGEAPKWESNGLIQCAMCKHFTYFHNEKGHNSPHALGKCQVKSWDGNKGQWAMFQHTCKNFVEADHVE